jgi:hypothetical protein
MNKPIYVRYADLVDDIVTKLGGDEILELIEYLEMHYEGVYAPPRTEKRRPAVRPAIMKK